MAAAISPMIHYPFSLIQELAACIKDLLDDETITSLKEIKDNNKFIRRRSPLRLKYKLNMSVAEEWRKEKTGATELDPLKRFSNSFTGLLNRLSDTNQEKIRDEIHTLIHKHIEEHSNSEEFQNNIIDSIFESAISEENYVSLYGNIAKSIINIMPDDFRSLLLHKIESYLEENLKKESANLTSKMDYDTLCAHMAEQSQFRGAYEYVGSLYHNDIISADVMREYCDQLMLSLMNSTGETIEKYVECIDHLLRNIGSKLQSDLSTDFVQETYIDPLDELSKDKKKLKAKFRFKLEDLVKYGKNSWETDSDSMEGWTVA